MFGLHDGIYFTIDMIYWCLMRINGVWNRMVLEYKITLMGFIVYRCLYCLIHQNCKSKSMFIISMRPNFLFFGDDSDCVLGLYDNRYV